MQTSRLQVFIAAVSLGFLFGPPSTAFPFLKGSTATSVDYQFQKIKTLSAIIELPIGIPGDQSKRRSETDVRHAQESMFGQQRFDDLVHSVLSNSKGEALDYFYLSVATAHYTDVIADSTLKQRGIEYEIGYLRRAATAMAKEQIDYPNQPCGASSECTRDLWKDIYSRARNADTQQDMRSGYADIPLVSAIGKIAVVLPDDQETVVWRYGPELVLRVRYLGGGRFTVLKPIPPNAYNQRCDKACDRFEMWSAKDVDVDELRVLTDKNEVLGHIYASDFQQKQAIRIDSEFAQRDLRFQLGDLEAQLQPENSPRRADQITSIRAQALGLQDQWRVYKESWPPGAGDAATEHRIRAVLDRTNGLSSARASQLSSALAAASFQDLTVQRLLQTERELCSLSTPCGRLVSVTCANGNGDECEGHARALGLPKPTGIREARTRYVIALIPTGRQKAVERGATETMPSTFVSGQSTAMNPRYQAAQMRLQAAQIDLQTAQQQYSSAMQQPPSFVAGMAQGAALGAIISARKNLDEANAALRSTSPSIAEDVLVPYEFRVSAARASVSERLGIILIDVQHHQARSWAVTSTLERDFRIASGRHELDRSIANFDSEADIQAWLDGQSPQFTIAALDSGASQRIENVPGSTPTDMVYAATKRAIGISASDGGIDVSSSSDPRLGYVVVIEAGQHLGSGFFVGRNYILTNAHVVSGQQTVGIQRYRVSSQISGLVVAVDVNRDLALIKVDGSYTAAKLWPAGKAMPVGGRIIAIGHPRGLNFSISSGIISAVRNHYEPAGGITLLQTDTALNPGNSGGPVFLGDAVVGVVTFKKGLDEGLGFAVHVDEIRAFLETALLL